MSIMKTVDENPTYDYYFTMDEPDHDHDYNPVALVTTGNYKGNKVFLMKDDKKNSNERLTPGGLEVLTTFLEREHPKLSKARFYNLIDLIIGKELQKDDLVVQQIYADFLKYKCQRPVIYFENGNLQVIPDSNRREIIYIAARSGVGKSTWISNYIKLWKRMNRKSPIWLVSTKPLSEEPAYQGLGMSQLDISIPNLKKIVGIEDKSQSRGKNFEINLSPYDNEIDEKSEKDKKKPNLDHVDLTEQDTNVAYRNFIDENSGASMLVMDDFDGLSKIQTDFIYNILKSVAELGRAKNIYLIVCRHSLADGMKTKTIINEATKFVIFPSGLSKDGVSYFVNSKLNISKDAILDILKLKGTHTYGCINTSSPQYYVSPNSVVMI